MAHPWNCWIVVVNVMLKLFSLKQKKQSGQEQTTENKPSSNKTTAAELRLQKGKTKYPLTRYGALNKLLA